MKKLTFTIVATLIALTAFAQSDEQIRRYIVGTFVTEESVEYEQMGKYKSPLVNFDNIKYKNAEVIHEEDGITTIITLKRVSE